MPSAPTGNAGSAPLVSLGGENGRIIRRLGLPMGLGQGVESAAFSSMTFFAGMIGTATLAAHQTTMTVMAMVYMNAVGLGGAASIRVGNAVGRRFPVGSQARRLERHRPRRPLLGPLRARADRLSRRRSRQPWWPIREAVAIATITLRMAGVLVGVRRHDGRRHGRAARPRRRLGAALAAVGGVLVRLRALAWYVGLQLEVGAVGLFIGIGAGIVASLALLLPRFRIVAARAASTWPGKPKSRPTS